MCQYVSINFWNDGSIKCNQRMLSFMFSDKTKHVFRSLGYLSHISPIKVFREILTRAPFAKWSFHKELTSSNRLLFQWHVVKKFIFNPWFIFTKPPLTDKQTFARLSDTIGTTPRWYSRQIINKNNILQYF